MKGSDLNSSVVRFIDITGELCLRIRYETDFTKLN